MTADSRLVAVGVLAHQQQDDLSRAAKDIAVDYPQLARKLEAVRFLLGDLLEDLRALSGEDDSAD